MLLVIQLLVLNISGIISPGEDAKIGTNTFPNTQKIPDNEQMDELTVVRLWQMLVAETP